MFLRWRSPTSRAIEEPCWRNFGSAEAYFYCQTDTDLQKVNKMFRMIALPVVLAAFVLGSPAIAQTVAPAPTSQTPAQQAPNSTGIPNCPTFAEQRAALGKKTSSGSEKLAAQPAERSGILPSAGTTSADPSAAPTMSENGKEYRSPLDCPLIPEHPNAVKPGTVVLPKLSE